jgi:uncharacterized protein (DUF1810 family)
LSARRPDLDGASALARFTEAQELPASGFDAALREIQSGAKTGHWIWYVFPQLAGLGSSSVSRTYGIHGLEEAREYLRNPTLQSRLLAITTEVANHLSTGASIDTLMGSEGGPVAGIRALPIHAGSPQLRKLSIAVKDKSHAGQEAPCQAGDGCGCRERAAWIR